MKKSTIPYFILLILLLLSLVPVAQAQEESPGIEAAETLNTILARAAARSFLTTLTRADLAGTTNFYLLDSLESSDLLARLQDPPVTGFKIIESGWISDVTYQVKAILEPEDREVAVYTGKYDGRWQVESLDLPTGQAETDEAAEAAVSAATGGVIPVRGNGSGQLVFQTRSGDDIYLINADGTGLRRITHGIDPQLSFDGSKIVFTRWEPNYELFTINTDGTGEQSWVSHWRQMKSPTWLANDERVVFSWQSGGRLEQDNRRVDLEKAAMEGDDIDIPSNAVGLEIDGNTLKYTVPADAFWSLKQVDLQPTTQLTDLATERHAYGPSGHPLQPTLFIYRGNNGLAMHNLETNTDQPLTTDFRDHTPVISPDGTRIAVSYWQDGHWEVHTMNIDGSNRQRLTETPVTVLAENRSLTREVVDGKERFVASENPAWNNAAPTWSPDGSQIAFVTDRTGRWEIWIMNADGTNQRPMFANGAIDDLELDYAGVDERMLSWR